MTDLHALLPDFAAADKYAALVAGLETHRVSLSELLTLDTAEIGKRTHLPLLDLRRLCEDVRAALAADVPRRRRRLKQQPRPSSAEDKEAGEQRPPVEPVPGEEESDACTQPPPPAAPSEPPPLPRAMPALVASKAATAVTGRISTLDPALDAALAGGFPTGCLAEVVGESGAGKTQLLLGLLLAVQLPPARGGLGRKALYIASEAPLPTGRLAQMLRAHPDGAVLRAHCSLANIATISTPDLEAQEHILTHQLPVQLSKAERFGGGPDGPGSFGLVVLDSVAANFRPFFGGGPGGVGGGGATGAKASGSLAARSLELTRLGMLLRTLAQKHNLAVVMANQVADRFDGGADGDGLVTSLSQSSPRWGGNVPRTQQAPWAAAKRLRQDSSMPPPSASTAMPPTQESPLLARSRRQQQQQQQHQQQQQQQQQSALALPMSSQTDVNGDGDEAKLPPSSMEPPPLPRSQPLLSSADDHLPVPTTQYVPPSLSSQFPAGPPAPPVLQLDHQQRWFTGWGDDPSGVGAGTGGIGVGARNKTPALGLVWATQLAVRVALVKAPRVGGGAGDDDESEQSTGGSRAAANLGAPRLRQSWRRWMKVVFAPHVAATGSAAALLTAGKIPASGPRARLRGAVEFEITMGGLRGLAADERKKR